MSASGQVPFAGQLVPVIGEACNLCLSVCSHFLCCPDHVLAPRQANVGAALLDNAISCIPFQNWMLGHKWMWQVHDSSTASFHGRNVCLVLCGPGFPNWSGIPNFDRTSLSACTGDMGDALSTTNFMGPAWTCHLGRFADLFFSCAPRTVFHCTVLMSNLWTCLATAWVACCMVLCSKPW